MSFWGSQRTHGTSSRSVSVLPILPDNKLLPTVRLTGCNVEIPQAIETPEIMLPKKWWKLW
jgi:hypothetical protein